MDSLQLKPYLFFDGNCKEAMEFYQTVLGGSLEMSSFGEAPEADSSEDGSRIMHANLKVDGVQLMGSDIVDRHDLTVGSNVRVSLLGTDEKRLRAVFLSLSEDGGKVTLALEKQFWGDIFGMLTDKFGIRWLITIRPAE